MEYAGCAGKVSTGKGSSEDSKSAVLIIFFKFNFNPIDPVESLEVLVKIGRFFRGNDGKDFIMADIRI